MASVGVSSVQTYVDALKGLLHKAKQIKSTTRIEPALTLVDLGEDVERFLQAGSKGISRAPQANYASIETAFRNTFYDFLVRANLCTCSI